MPPYTHLGWPDSRRQSLPPYVVLVAPRHNAYDLYAQAAASVPEAAATPMGRPRTDRERLLDAWNAYALASDSDAAAPALPAIEVELEPYADCLRLLHEAACHEYAPPWRTAADPRLRDSIAPPPLGDYHRILVAAGCARLAHGEPAEALRQVEDLFAIAVALLHSGPAEDCAEARQAARAATELDLRVLRESGVGPERLLTHAAALRRLRERVRPLEDTALWQAHYLMARAPGGAQGLPVACLRATNKLGAPAHWALPWKAPSLARWAEDRNVRLLEAIASDPYGAAMAKLSAATADDIRVRHDDIAPEALVRAEGLVNSYSYCLESLALLEAAAGAEACRARYGCYPTTPAHLGSDCLPALPPEPFTGHSVRCSGEADRCRLSTRAEVYTPPVSAAWPDCFDSDGVLMLPTKASPSAERSAALVTALARLGHRPEALSLLTREHERFPGGMLDDAWVSLGLAAYRDCDWEAACEAWSHARLGSPVAAPAEPSSDEPWTSAYVDALRRTGRL